MIHHGKNSTEEEIINGLNMRVVNDPCESNFGVFANQITTHSHVSLANSSGMVVIKKNGDFNTGCKKLGSNS